MVIKPSALNEPTIGKKSKKQEKLEKKQEKIKQSQGVIVLLRVCELLLNIFS